jgi:hypothetical protein
VTTLYATFAAAAEFNQNIALWNVARVTVMGGGGVVYSATKFNADIGAWNTASVTVMHAAFQSATAFNQNIGAWNVARVANMVNMLYEAKYFNQNLASWNVLRVTALTGAFYCTTGLSDCNKAAMSAWCEGWGGILQAAYPTWSSIVSCNAGAAACTLLNPAEGMRFYSSTYQGNAIGTGYARSMLSSAQAWSANVNTLGQHMTIIVGACFAPRPRPRSGTRTHTPRPTPPHRASPGLVGAVNQSSP